MAWVKVQGATALGSGTASTTETSNALPSAPTAGNTLLAAIAINKNSLSGFTPPSGWTTLGAWQDTSGVYMAIVGKIADGSETSGITFSWSTSTVFCDICGPYEFSGGPSTIGALLEWADGNTFGNSATPGIAATDTASYGDELLIFLAGRVSRNALVSGPTDSFTLDDDSQSVGGNASSGVGLTFAHKILTATEAPTVGITLGNTREWNAAVLSLKTAADAAGVTHSDSPSGTITCGGSVAESHEVDDAVSGGVTVSGSVVELFSGPGPTHSDSPSGSIALGGSVGESYSVGGEFDDVLSGGVLFGGSSLESWAVSVAVVGDLLLSGVIAEQGYRSLVVATTGSGSLEAASSSTGTLIAADSRVVSPPIYPSNSLYPNNSLYPEPDTGFGAAPTLTGTLSLA